MPAAAAMVPGSPCPSASRPQGLCCLVSTRQFKPAGLAAPWVPSTCYTVLGACHHTPSESRLQALLFCWCQETSFPTEHRGSAIPTVPVSKTALAPPSKSMNDSSNLLFFRQHQKPCSPKVHRSPVLHTAPPCRIVTCLMPKSWNPSSSTKWQPATLPVLGDPNPPQCTET
jgi:hypothetical protein